jgi:hypothetical protein
MFFMVLKDDVAFADRQTGTQAINVEVQILGYAFKHEELKDVIYLRYKIINRNVSDMKDTYFSIFSRFGLGEEYRDDAIACDTIFDISEGIVDDFSFRWNDTTNTFDGSAKGLDFIQGPLVNGEITDTAYVRNGINEESYFSKRNAKMGSFYPFGSSNSPLSFNPVKSSVRRAMIGGIDKDGRPIDPTNWESGSDSDNPRYFFSGDPILKTGWINKRSRDDISLMSTEKFDIPAGGSQEIVVAWVFGRNSLSSNLSPNLSAIQEMRKNDIRAQKFHDGNYKYIEELPQPSIKAVERNDNGIDLIVDLDINGTNSFSNIDAFDELYRFGGVEIYQFKYSDLKADSAGEKKLHILGRFNIGEDGWKLLAPAGNEILLHWQNGINIDSTQKRIILNLEKDPLRDEAFKKGRRYYFGARAFAYNESTYSKRFPSDYTSRFVIPERNENTVEFRFGEESIEKSGKIELFYSGEIYHGEHVELRIIEPLDLTGDEYELDFYKTALNELRYSLRNSTKNIILADSGSFLISNKNDRSRWNAPIMDGFQVYVVDSVDVLANRRFEFNTAVNKKRLSKGYKKKQLNHVKVVPNPFYAQHEGMTDPSDPYVMFTNLPAGDVEIRLFTVNGQYLAKIEKNDDSSYLRWNLKNARGKRVASGLYIAHVKAKDVGEKVVKLYVFTDR